MRLIAVLSILLPGPQVVAYVVLWILFPSEQRASTTPGSPTVPA